jgi:preprotein translocase subunit SecA
MIRHAVAPYAERVTVAPNGFDLGVLRIAGAWASRLTRIGGIEAYAQRIAALSADYTKLSDLALLTQAARLRPGLLRDPAGMRDHVFALTSVAVQRHTGLRYFPVQLAGGRALIGRKVVEMATGEGKTITAILPAVMAGLCARPVHIVTVNDYLAERDANRLRPVYGALGLTVGLVKQGDSPEARRAAYAADITYVTNKELVFDYLKDRIASAAARGDTRQKVASLFKDGSRGLLLRGLHVAIVDEADSVLIDEARTPLIISAERKDTKPSATSARALAIAAALEPRTHYVLDEGQRALVLTAAAQAVIGRESEGFVGVFRARHAREQLISQALTALRMLKKDRDYIVRDGTVQIVDEYTGRIMPDRSWEQGLHQLVETKEGLAGTGARETLARITYQRFFNRYLHLCGMTGTAMEVAGELRAVYGLGVSRLPTNRPVRRRYLGGVVVADAAAKWAKVADRAASLARSGRPLLIGTQSVEASEALAEALRARGLPHVVLNARQDEQEAEIVARAGEPGRITVATNMAGRGTDILLGPDEARAGGLHVIATGYHDSQRIDRQLFGRAARQGDPGSCESIVALDDELFRRFAPRLAEAVSQGGVVARLGGALLRRYAQTQAGRSHARERRDQMLMDERLEKGMAFTERE